MAKTRRPTLAKIFKTYQKLNEARTKLQTMQYDFSSLMKQFGQCRNELFASDGKLYRITINNHSYSGPHIDVDFIGDVEAMEKTVFNK